MRPYFNIFFAAFTAELSSRVRKGGKYIRIVIERMPAKIYAERFMLHIKLFRFRKFRNIRQLNKASSYAFPAAKVKKAHLPRCGLLPVPRGKRKRLFVHSHKLGALCACAVETTNLYHGLHHALVYIPRTVCKVHEILEASTAIALFYNILHRPFAHVAYTRKAEANLTILHAEFFAAFIYVRRQHCYAHAARGAYVARNLVNIADEAIQHCRHKFNGVIYFKISRSVRKHGVACRVRLIERIGGKVRHSVEYLIRRVRIHAVPHGSRHAYNAVLLYAVHKVMPFLLHNIVLLFCHCAAHKVAATHRIARHVAHNAHDLLLIYHAAIRCFKRGAKLFAKIRYLIRMVLAGKILGYLVHWAGPEKRNSRDKVFKAAWPKLQHELLHARGFKLEHAVRIGRGYHFIYAPVRIVLKLLIRHLFALLPYKIKRIAYYGKRS